MSKFKGNALKKKKYPVYLECLGEEVNLSLNMAALASIEDFSGGLNEALERVQKNDFKAISAFFAALITAGEGEECTPEWVLNNFEFVDFFSVANVISEKFNDDEIKKLANQMDVKHK